MDIKGAIFDFDGTLFDSMPMWNAVGEEYLKIKNISANDNIRDKLKTMSLFQAAQYFRQHYGISDSIENIINDINNMLEAFYRDIVQPKPYVIDFLAMLKKKDVKMCIATATDRPLAEAALKRCNMSEYFLEIFTCSRVGCGKENPDIYDAALEFLSCNIDEVIVFEDALHAIKTAKKAGFKVCAIFDESEKDILSVKNTADFYISNFSDITRRQIL